MKNIMLLVAFIVYASVSAQTTAFTISHKFLGIVEGYDHLCKTQVWIDGEMIGESPETIESAGVTFTVDVPTGNHEVYIVNQALYDGVWEDHVIENDYSIDCLWKGSHNFKKKKEKFFMLFDIDKGTSVDWKKMPKPVEN